MNREQLAWAAGIVDGEGTFYAAKQHHILKNGVNRTYYRPTMSVTQTAKYGGVPDMLTRLKEIFPKATLNGPYKKPHKNHADYYDFKLHGFNGVQYAMCLLWNWLGSQKKQDAIIMMEEYLNNRPPMEWRKGPAKGSRQDWERDHLGRFVSHD